jgi:hypothetical protein
MSFSSLIHHEPLPIFKVTFNHHAINRQSSCRLFRLPIELRLQIYNYLLTNVKPRPLHVGRYVWSSHNAQPRAGTLDYRNLLVSCGRAYEEMSDLIYSQHELTVYLDRVWDSGLARPTKLVGDQLGEVEKFGNLFRRLHRLNVTIFVTGEEAKDKVVIALLTWLKTVLVARERPLRMLTLWLCATGWKFERRPVAVLYAAQALGRIAPTTFHLHCGFQGPECAAIVSDEAIKRLPEGRCAEAQPGTTEDEALRRFVGAWSQSLPEW